MEGEGSAARSTRSSTPYDSMVTRTRRQSTPRKPSTVARPQGAQAAGSTTEGRGQGEDTRADHRAHDQGDERAQGKCLVGR